MDIVGVGFGLIVVCPADAVVGEVERVNVDLDLVEALRLCILAEDTGVRQIEVSIEVKHDALLPECLAAVGHGRTAGQFRTAHILKPLSAVEIEQQVFLLRRRLQHSRVGEDDGGIFIAVGHLVDHDAVEHACLQVFFLHIDVALGDAVIEDALGNFEFRTLLLHRNKQLTDFSLRLWSDIVLEIKGTECDSDHDEGQRTEGLE